MKLSRFSHRRNEAASLTVYWEAEKAILVLRSLKQISSSQHTTLSFFVQRSGTTVWRF